MSWSRATVVALVVSVTGCALPVPVVAAGVCPARSQQPLRFVDVFDGPPEELATLVPDRAEQSSGSWQLGYVYDAGRFVTIRCKYADGEARDVKLTAKVARCDYRLDAQKTLTVNCG
jgi:hypothetical protein